MGWAKGAGPWAPACSRGLGRHTRCTQGLVPVPSTTGPLKPSSEAAGSTLLQFLVPGVPAGLHAKIPPSILSSHPGNTQALPARYSPTWVPLQPLTFCLSKSAMPGKRCGSHHPCLPCAHCDPLTRMSPPSSLPVLPVLAQIQSPLTPGSLLGPPTQLRRSWTLHLSSTLSQWPKPRPPRRLGAPSKQGWGLFLGCWGSWWNSEYFSSSLGPQFPSLYKWEIGPDGL